MASISGSGVFSNTATTRWKFDPARSDQTSAWLLEITSAVETKSRSGLVGAELSSDFDGGGPIRQSESWRLSSVVVPRSPKAGSLLEGWRGLPHGGGWFNEAVAQLYGGEAVLSVAVELRRRGG
ncbi:hypothetical protein M6B38_159380 [Iris pallida]|uniref:Uncharacterized protein n=1 Tax=Iris pallida TaxID=29817 RepID=A0AAX6F0Q7_IRIPA|nr:hypothetical protein M6B38_159380 [Iris pallida]